MARLPTEVHDLPSPPQPPRLRATLRPDRVRPGPGSAEPKEPGRLRDPHARTTTVCDCCHSTQPQVDLVRPTGPGHIRVCRPCLRSSLQRQADLSQRRNLAILQDFAEENGLQVWTSGDVLYALPPQAPFNAA